MNQPAVIVLLFLIVIIAASLLVYSYIQRQKLIHRLRLLGYHHFLEAAATDPAWMIILRNLARPLAGAKVRAELNERLNKAGYYDAWQVDACLVGRAVFIFLVLIGGFIYFEVDLRTIFKDPLPVFKLLILLAVCGRIPDWLLRDSANRHWDRIRASVPRAVDFMTICVESGLSLEDAFDKVGQEMRVSAPEVAAEMRLTRSEMLMLDRSKALQRLKRRSGVREMENLADALLQSIRFGTPLVDTLQSIASESRAAQVSALEEKAGAISARVGLPLIIMVLFPLVVLLAAPPIIQFFRTM